MRVAQSHTAGPPPNPTGAGTAGAARSTAAAEDRRPTRQNSYAGGRHMVVTTAPDGIVKRSRSWNPTLS